MGNRTDFLQREPAGFRGLRERWALVGGADAGRERKSWSFQQSGKTVRRKGAGVVIDGPFAEGSEAVLGFFFVRVRDLDESCAIAGESPHAEIGGAIEVRGGGVRDGAGPRF